MTHLTLYPNFACKRVTDIEQVYWEYIMVRFINSTKVQDEHPHSHPNIICYSHVLVNNALLLYSPRYESDLSRGTWSAHQIESIGRQMESAISFLHQAGVIHRDIKPSNMLWKTRQGDIHVVLADFGSAAFVTECDAEGTIEYRDPELWKGTSFSTSSDIWSLGASLFNIQHRVFLHNQTEKSTYDDVVSDVKRILETYGGNPYLHLDPSRRAPLPPSNPPTRTFYPDSMLQFRASIPDPELAQVVVASIWKLTPVTIREDKLLAALPTLPIPGESTRIV
jgi:serine/threonine protein kinase